MNPPSLVRLCAVLIGLMASLAVAYANDLTAPYVLRPGDIVSLKVVGVPELTTKLPIGVDGTVTFPLIGQFSIAGLTLSQAREAVQKLMPERPVSRTTSDGTTYSVAVNRSDISVSIDEYRPIYVSGDVAKPGEQAFRSGLTVRRAIAVAGGYDVFRFKIDNPVLQSSDIKSEYERLWITYVKQQATLARLNSELSAKAKIDIALTPNIPVSKSLRGAIEKNEQDQLEMNNLDFAKETEYLKLATAHEAERAQVLTEEQSKETDGVNADSIELQRYQDLFKKGALALPSLADARRTLLLSSARALQTTALLASVERERLDLNRRLDRLADNRRTEVLRATQDVIAQLAETKSKLQAASEKFRYTGMLKSQLVGGLENEPTIFIFHDTSTHTNKTAANLDTQLEPGDTVEVELKGLAPVDN